MDDRGLEIDRAIYMTVSRTIFRSLAYDKYPSAEAVGELEWHVDDREARQEIPWLLRLELQER